MWYRRRFAVRTLVVLVAMGMGLLTGAGPVGAQGGEGRDDAPPEAPTTTFRDAVPGRIIPEPNTGRPPEEPGDRGGWQQGLVLVLVVGGLVVIGLLVARDAARRRRPSTGAD